MACRYKDLTACMDKISMEELIMAVRRQSQGFSRGTSTYRGVTHHPSGAIKLSLTTSSRHQPLQSSSCLPDTWH